MPNGVLFVGVRYHPAASIAQPEAAANRRCLAQALWLRGLRSAL